MFDTWRIPQRVIDATIRAFLRGNHEVFTLWTAPLARRDGRCDVTRCVVPEQEPGDSEFGVYVHIEGKELARIQFDNLDHDEWNVVQLHTHPSTSVEMSGLDRKWEVVSHPGALSIIVPSYGRRGLDRFPGVHVYERETDDWRLWPSAEVSARISVVP